jgi:hypothetical protein
VNPPDALPKDELVELNNLANKIWRNESLTLPPSTQDTLTNLKRAPSVLLGPSRPGPTFEVLSPVRTLVKSVQPTFKWTNVSGATSYTVHVIADDRTQEEIATSPPLPAAAVTTANPEWSLPESISLTPGQRYRWYVTAVLGDQEIDAPGAQQMQAKFGVLSEYESARLDASKKEARSDQFIDGLLNLKAGLLDDAEADFESLLASPTQSAAAKDFLGRMIQEIRRLKEA